jgi:heat shock protein HtpX
MAKRVALFILTNALVIFTISLIMGVLGVGPYLSRYGLNYTSLAIFCGLFGVVGSFISLALSKKTAKWFMGVRTIPDNPRDPELRFVLDTVERLSHKANLKAVPEVGIYDSDDVNAFATGPSQNNSLVAVSTGMLDNLDREELEGVLAHEIAHIENGDMITMTLLQGVVNAFVMFAARVVAWGLMTALGEEEGGGISWLAYMLVVLVLEMVFMVFGMLVISGFSRFREYRADEGGARLAGRDKMLAALKALQDIVPDADVEQGHPSVQAFQINGEPHFLRFFSSHPPLDKRIERLQGFRG